MLELLGDRNNNGVFDAADYMVWGDDPKLVLLPGVRGVSLRGICCLALHHRSEECAHAGRQRHRQHSPEGHAQGGLENGRSADIGSKAAQ